MNSQHIQEKLEPDPTNTFPKVYDYLDDLPSKESDRLFTTGKKGVTFTAEAWSNKRDGRKCIRAVSGKKNQSKIYIYENDWEYKTNSSGTRIAHYTISLDQWMSEQK